MPDEKRYEVINVRLMHEVKPKLEKIQALLMKQQNIYLSSDGDISAWAINYALSCLEEKE